MERRPQSGQIYRHFKNKLYQVITIATHSETGEELVIYQALYGDYRVYARELSMFVSEVDHEKYPQVTQKYRFELVNLTENGDMSFQQEINADIGKESSVNAGTMVYRENDNAVGSDGQGGFHKSEDFSETSDVSEGSAEDSMIDGVHPKLMEFLEADSCEERYKILSTMGDIITDSMIDTMAVVMDVVIPEGQLENRYDDLKRVIRTRQQYENASRLR